MEETVWVIEDPDNYLKRKIEEAPPIEQKNPAVAYTLSFLLWGAGQIYNGQMLKGLLFLLLMLIFCAGSVLFIVYMKPVLHFLRYINIANAEIFIICEILFFSALIFWNYNAGNAYHKAMKMRRDPFTGVQSRVLPFLCSLFVPGWGQFLNGQARKGSIFIGFSILSLFSMVSIPLVFVFWTSLEASKARFIIEGILAITLLFAPFIPFIWLFGCSDALKVSLDDTKKESFIKRLKYVNNRRRLQGWGKGVFPHIKLTLKLGLFLVLLLVISYFYFPKEYYTSQLRNIQTRLYRQEMVIVPHLIGRVLVVEAPEGESKTFLYSERIKRGQATFYTQLSVISYSLLVNSPFSSSYELFDQVDNLKQSGILEAKNQEFPY